MGQPVVHFEVIGRDAAKLHSYYGELFGWEIDANNPMKYGVVQRDGTPTQTASGSAAAWARARTATAAT